MRRQSALVALFASVLGASACGGGSSLAMCRDPGDRAVGSCGGELYGTWRYVDTCGRTTDEALCTGVVHDDRTSTDATLHFDGANYKSAGTQSGSEVSTFPLDCVGWSAAECDGFSEQLVNGATTCASSGDTCTCTTTRDGAFNTKGTYVVNGGFLRVAFTAGGESDFVYCVDGDTLIIDGGEDSPYLFLRYARESDLP